MDSTIIIAREAGVADITPLKAKLNFALAIKYEREGNTDKAEGYLARAIAFEQGTEPTVH